MDGWTPNEATWQDTSDENIFIEGEFLRIYNSRTKREKPLLTERQHDFATCLKVGFSPKEIAEKQRITARCVRQHIQKARKKAELLL